MPHASTLQKLGLVCLASSVVPSASALTVAISAAQALGVLQQRDATCGNDTFKTCTSVNSALPSNFCCPSNTACISLDSSSSALCCPAGADCTLIRPIPCSLDQQDVTQNHNAVVMTIRLRDKLPTCNGSCCPFGYACGVDSGGSAVCQLDIATSSLGAASNNSTSSFSTSTPSSSSTAKATSTSTSTASASTSSGEGIDSTKPLATSTCSKFPGSAVAVGFFTGLIAGVISTLIAVICLGNRHPNRTSKVSSKLSSHFRGRSADGTIIGVSGPIPQDQGARTDFLLRNQPGGLKRTGTRVKSWFSTRGTQFPENGGSPHNKNHWKMPTPPVPNNIPLQPLGATLPVTPKRHVRAPPAHAATTLARQPSTESIRVYSPQSMVDAPTTNKGTQQTPRRTAQESSKLSPFKTPDKNYTPTTIMVAKQINADTLTPSRFEGGQARTKNPPREDASRPTTTFTDMLHGIGFPDPGPPAVPEVPKGLTVKKGKRI